MKRALLMAAFIASVSAQAMPLGLRTAMWGVARSRQSAVPMFALDTADGRTVAVPKAWIRDFLHLPEDWIEMYPESVAESLVAPAQNGRTVWVCYILGIDPEDPEDDLKITDFKMEDGRPVIALNHTADGSGNSFGSRVKTLGKAELADEEWLEVPAEGDSSLKFFTVEVEMP